MEDISYECLPKQLKLKLPTKNKGKFRWKERDSNFDYGKVFATTSIPFSESSYLEWQIGYDSELNHKTKTTILNNLTFIGSNEKQKNPYELSEILHLLIESNIVTKKEVRKLISEVNAKNFSFDEEFQIRNLQATSKVIEGIKFNRQDIVLPTFSYFNKHRDPAIEISIQKQQYASGIQPMLYLTIPINNFENLNQMIGRLSSEVESANLLINDENFDVFIKIFTFFGLCSENHKQDILSILSLLSN